MNKNYIVILLIALALISTVGVFTPSVNIDKVVQKVMEQLNVGGLTHNIQESFNEGIAVDGKERIDGFGNFTVGGAELALDKIASSSLTAAQLCDNRLITYNPYDANSDSTHEGASLSFPSSASIIADCVRNIGDSKTVVFENVASAASRESEFSTSDDYDIYWTGGTVINQDYLDIATVRFTNLNGTSISYEVTETTTGD
jgi:hypothetical protein